jgi:hypothetical protein
MAPTTGVAGLGWLLLAPLWISENVRTLPQPETPDLKTAEQFMGSMGSLHLGIMYQVEVNLLMGSLTPVPPVRPYTGDCISL